MTKARANIPARDDLKKASTLLHECWYGTAKFDSLKVSNKNEHVLKFILAGFP